MTPPLCRLRGVILASIVLFCSAIPSAHGEQPGLDERVSLYRAVNENWLRDAVIAADQSSVTSFSILQDSIDADLKELFEKLEDSETLDAEERKAVDLYKSYLSFDRREELGIQPIQKDLQAIDRLATHAAIASHFSHLLSIGSSSPLLWTSGPDFKDSTRFVLWACQSGLGLPEQEIYLSSDDRSKMLRATYKAHLSKLFQLGGFSDAEARAARVLALETGLATIQWTPAMQRDQERSFNIRTAEQMSSLLPSFGVSETLDHFGISKSVQINAAQLSYIEALEKFVREQPVADWQDYLRARVLFDFSHLLSGEFHAADVEYQIELGLVTEDTPRWKQALQFVGSSVPMLVGKLYVKHYFDEGQKNDAAQLVHEIRAAAAETISNSSRLSAATKQKALTKLEKMTFNIGYPERWQDFSSLITSPGSLVDNAKSATRYQLQDSFAKLSRPADKSEWDRSPHEVNAFYDLNLNKFVLLAGILKPPFYNPEGSDAQRYGGIGFVIGHEIGHAFDDGGSHFDSDGNLNNWWTDADRKEFNKAKDALVRQANAFEILPGTHLNGPLEVGEIIGDNTGARLALLAFGKAITRKKLDPVESHREFFRQIALIWREKLRPELQRTLVATDPHPPGIFRTDEVVKNLPEFHSAWDTKPGDPMYLDPSARVAIW
ncbi:MAG: M13 family metallopeptidase [Deltaproteobacteria bacterium]|nr:M13 family metallopeptidase [Deltaproteobacteria bacterium]